MWEILFHLPNVCTDKIGLGAESPEVTKKREREEMERITASKRMKLESEFKMAARDNYEAKKISYRLAEAVRVCRHLDETKSIQENELLAEFDNAEKREEPLTIAKYISQELSPDDVRIQFSPFALPCAVPV